MKKERLALTSDLFEKRFQAEDWDGALLQQVCVSSAKNFPQAQLQVQVQMRDMIDRLEKNSGQTVVSLKEAKMLLKVRK